MDSFEILKFPYQPSRAYSSAKSKRNGLVRAKRVVILDTEHYLKSHLTDIIYIFILSDRCFKKTNMQISDVLETGPFFNLLTLPQIEEMSKDII